MYSLIIFFNGQHAFELMLSLIQPHFHNFEPILLSLALPSHNQVPTFHRGNILKAQEQLKQNLQHKIKHLRKQFPFIQENHSEL